MMTAHRPLIAFTLGACALLAGCHSSAPAEKSPMSKDFTLTSASITPPDWSEETFPVGPGSEAMDNNCRACHSPSMVLVQPPLSHDDWAKEVAKMQGVFKAPVDDKDVPAILNYLDDFSAKQKAAAPGG